MEDELPSRIWTLAITGSKSELRPEHLVSSHRLTRDAQAQLEAVRLAIRPLLNVICGPMVVVQVIGRAENGALTKLSPKGEVEGDFITLTVRQDRRRIDTINSRSD